MSAVLTQMSELEHNKERWEASASRCRAADERRKREATAAGLSRLSSVGHFPTSSKWEFDESVTKVFDDMIARSIPGYSLMRSLTRDLALHYAQDNTWIVDLGTSKGEALYELIRERGARNRFLGVEISDDMLAAARETLGSYVQTGVVELRKLDLREKYPPMKTSVTLSVLTLQFTPIEYRQTIVQQIYDNLLPGGAFLFVEKVLGRTAAIQNTLIDHYHDLKHANGYSRDEIAAKRKSLEGALVPLTAAQNEQMLRDAGFTKLDCFWRVLNFAAWIAVK